MVPQPQISPDMTLEATLVRHLRTRPFSLLCSAVACGTDFRIQSLGLLTALVLRGRRS